MVGSEVQVPWHGRLDSFGLPQVQRLTALGVLKSRSDEFGDASFQVEPSRVEWSLRLRLSSPCLPHWRSPSCDPKSLGKLSLLLMLHREGFRKSATAITGPLVQGGPMIYDVNVLSKSKAYLLALLHCESIFAKRVAGIHHDRTQAYYMCLLHLPAEKLISIEGLVAEKQARKLLTEALPVGEPLAIMDGDGDASDDEQVGRGIAQELWGNGGRIVQAPTAHECVVDGTRIVVHRTWSHSSGALRFYLRCPGLGHHRCFRYTQRSKYNSDEECIAFLLAWAAHGSGLESKEQHKGFAPTPEQLAQMLDGL